MDDWHEPVEESEYNKWLARMDEKTRNRYLAPPPKLAEWAKVYCGCIKCVHTDYYLKGQKATSVCLKEEARLKQLWQRSYEQLFPPVKKTAGGDKWWGLGEDFINKMLGTSEGVAEWKAFNEKKDAEIKKLVERFDSRKWDPLEMAVRNVENEALWAGKPVWKYIAEEPEWVAYREIGHEQYKMHGDYAKVVAAGIKSKEDYAKADKLYKELGQHIDKHGHIMKDDLVKLHKLPKEKPTEAPKMGRRAARKLRNSSESSTATVSRAEARASKVATVQSYMTLRRDDE